MRPVPAYLGEKASEAMGERDLDCLIDDVAALETRTEAIEARLAAAEARQLRTEKQLIELTVEMRSMGQCLSKVQADVEELQHTVEEVLVGKVDKLHDIILEAIRFLRPPGDA